MTFVSILAAIDSTQTEPFNLIAAILLLISCLFAVGGSCACSLTEATLLSLNTVRLETLRSQGNVHAKIWIEMKNSIDKPISAILILNTTANTVGATIAGYLFNAAFGESYVWIFVLIFSLAVLYVGEIGPKFIGATYCEELAPILARPLQVAIFILGPIIAITETFAARFKGKGAKDQLTSADIEVLAQLARSKNIIAYEQERMIVKASKLRELKERDVMIPKEWIVFLRLDRPIEDNLKLAQHAMHTRYPVSSTRDVQRIMGYINIKDMSGFANRIDEFDLESFIRPILTVDPDRNVQDAIKLLTSKNYHIALVKDDADVVHGLITLEDLSEEVIGDIDDEFDVTASDIFQMDPQLWRIGAGVKMERACQIIGIPLPEGAQDKTLGQWLTGYLPERVFPGSSHIMGRHVFTVQQRRRGRIMQILVEEFDTEAQAIESREA